MKLIKHLFSKKLDSTGTKENPIKDVQIIHTYENNTDIISAQLEATEELDLIALEGLIAELLSGYIVKHDMIHMTTERQGNSPHVKYVGSLTLVTNSDMRIDEEIAESESDETS